MLNTRKSIFKIGVSAVLVSVISVIIAFTSERRDQQVKSPFFEKGINDTLFHPRIDSGELVLNHLYYDFVYEESHEQAKWIFYKLYPSYIIKSFERKNDFRKDPFVSSGSADHLDYKGSGFDRGHLMPAADMVWSKEALSESFFYSNMSPQYPSFNRGIWKRLESRVRKWVSTSDSLYIVTGPKLNMKLNSIGHNEVSVPDYYYKVILKFHQNSTDGIAFLMPNESSKANLSDYVLTIDDLEENLDLDFFHYLNDSLQHSIESNSDLSQWSW
jgi:endonuclease G